ncbi:MAG: BMP family ABC transporter substrate-binding protein, partial [Clostridia bacterium]|nr:BMP family ABC transporter substrate-binding protein [Clostridia bacterium]
MKKLLALLLVAVMLFSFAACGGDDNNDDAGNAGTNEATGLSEALLPAPEIKKDFEIDANFKIGIICLHDENSTYDLNFINAVLAVKKALGLTDDQVILKRNIPESNDCYEAAKDLAVKGCKVVFANSFGHETYMIQAAKEYKDVEFCHATGTMAHTEKLANFHN